MSVRAGLNPWNEYKAVTSFSNANGMQWDLSSGWHLKRKSGWKKTEHRTARYVTGPDGKKYKVYDYVDMIGFHANEADSSLAQERLAYALDSLQEDSIEEEGCGHISKLMYSRKGQVLFVKFYNDDMCVFFRVPTSVAGELIHLARTKTTFGDTDKHLLGIRFWDLVRIRGMLHGARYPFEYANKGTRVFVKNTNDIRVKRFVDEHRSAEVVDKKAIEEFQTFSTLENKLADAMERLVDEFKNRPDVLLAEHVYESEHPDAPNKGKWKAVLEDTDAADALKEIMNLKTGKPISANSRKKLFEIIRKTGLLTDLGLNGPGDIRTWVKKNAPIIYEAAYSGKIWTPEDLKNFANYKVEGNISARHADTYKMFIDAQDWQGALNYLKSKSTTKVAKNEKGQVIKNYKPQRYAGQYDILATEE